MLGGNVTAFQQDIALSASTYSDGLLLWDGDVRTIRYEADQLPKRCGGNSGRVRLL